MPTTKIQKLFFMFLTVLLSVCSFVIYNVAISMGGMSNQVFIIALKEIPIEFIFAFLLEFSIANNFAEKLAFKIVTPQKDKPIFIILAITCMTVCIMCPSMSLIATILYNGFTTEFIANWFQKIIFNFPFAFFIQIFLIGPVVRSIFKTVFPLKEAENISIVK